MFVVNIFIVIVNKTSSNIKKQSFIFFFVDIITYTISEWRKQVF